MNATIKETQDGKFLANTEDLFPLPSSGGYNRLHKSWRKTVTSLNKTKTNGYSIVGDFVNNGPRWFTPGLYLACAWRGSVKNQSPYYALYKLTPEGDILTLADVDGGRDWAVKLWPIIETALNPPTPVVSSHVHTGNCQHNFTFKVELGAIAATPEQAWDYACESFTQDPGSMPDDFSCDSDICDECSLEIPIIGNGGLANKHHDKTCSLYDPTQD